MWTEPPVDTRAAPDVLGLEFGRAGFDVLALGEPDASVVAVTMPDKGDLILAMPERGGGAKTITAPGVLYTSNGTENPPAVLGSLSVLPSAVSLNGP